MKKSTCHFVISAAIVCLTSLASGNADAQLLSPTNARCAATGPVDLDIGRRRMAWALECRKRFECNVNAISWGARVLTNDSLFGDPADPDITGWEELDPASKQQVFPLYYNSMLNTYWDAPLASVYPKASWADYACGTHAVSQADCDTYKPVYGNGIRNIGLCWSGCYTPEMKLSFASGDIGIKAAHEGGQLDIVTLSPGATIDNLEYIDNKIKAYTVDIEEQRQEIYNFKTESGGTLRVTSEHALLTNDGIMRQAQELTTAQYLVKRNGSPDRISSIKKEMYFGKVYNLKPVTYDYQSNIVVAQGYLSGSVRYQNEYLDMINSIILRRAIPEELAQAQ